MSKTKGAVGTPAVTIFREREHGVDTAYLGCRFDGQPELHGEVLQRSLAHRKFYCITEALSDVLRDQVDALREITKSKGVDCVSHLNLLTKAQAKDSAPCYIYVVYLGKRGTVMLEVYEPKLGTLIPGKKLYAGPVDDFSPEE